MARRNRPSNSDTLGAIVAEGYVVKASCDRCDVWKDVDVPRLIGIKGADYCLWNRTTPCRVTPGCKGRARFYIYARRGMTEPMYDDR